VHFVNDFSSLVLIVHPLNRIPILFGAEIYQNNIFLFLKIIFEISILKRSKTYKKLIFSKKKLNFGGTRFAPRFQTHSSLENIKINIFTKAFLILMKFFFIRISQNEKKNYYMVVTK
jgi:hypothetical protein